MSRWYWCAARASSAEGAIQLNMADCMSVQRAFRDLVEHPANQVRPLDPGESAKLVQERASSRPEARKAAEPSRIGAGHRCCRPDQWRASDGCRPEGVVGDAGFVLRQPVLFLPCIGRAAGVLISRRQGWSSCVAIAAAYLLVVQTLVTGIVLGLQAGSIQAGVDGHVICNSVGAPSAPQGSGQPADPSEHQTCCILGCRMLGPTALPLSASSITLGAPAAAATLAPSQPSDRIGADLERSPRKTRAPPRTDDLA
jgi:hypothetical protein